MPLNLNLKTEPTYHVDWFTYAWMRKENIVGFDEFIADCYDFDKPMEIGSGNDTNYSVHVTPKKPKELWIEDLVEIKRCGYLEEHQLSLVLCDLCHDGHIPEGIYVVTVCW